MPDIRYVSFSDMHFGADNSLLTHMAATSTKGDPTKPSRVLSQLVACLKELISKNENTQQKPTLILNGDILELALTTDDQAAMAFERFLELVLPPGQEPLFDKTIIYAPGNHDHHLWETAREAQYAKHIAGLGPGALLPIPWHATNAFSNPVPSVFLNTLVHRVCPGSDVTVATAYPNFGLLTGDHKKCVMFHHGHFSESIYWLMSTLNSMLFPNRRKPTHVWDVEAENFAWIDFFWSTLGRSGEVGQDMELIYDKMQDRQAFGEVLDNLAASLVKQHLDKHEAWFARTPVLGAVLRAVGEPIQARMLGWALRRTIGRIGESERSQTNVPLTDEGKALLRAYVEGPMREQIRIEQQSKKHPVPSDVTIVFGHTHKPFQEIMRYDKYPQPVPVYNSGGWVIDSLTPDNTTGGAAVLIDEELNLASLRLYTRVTDRAGDSVKLETATETPFSKRLTSAIDPARDPWKPFSQIAAEEIVVREKSLEAHIKSQ